MSDKKNLFSKLKSRFFSAVPDRRIQKEQFEELHTFIGEIRSLINTKQEDLNEKLDKQNELISNNLDIISNNLDIISESVKDVRTIVGKSYDRIFDLRRKLVEVRKSDTYLKVFEDQEPLITVRIATYNNPDLLVERAIKSVYAQTYSNWEIVIVGDGCEEDTQIAIDKLNDPRIKYFNFPYRNVYPEVSMARWQVAGSPGMNKAVELAKGTWIAPLDDDDEFSPNHIEVLLEKALAEKFEFVYGAFKQVFLSKGQEQILKAYPPKLNYTPAQSGIYPKVLDFFEWDMQCWVVNEPGDWNFIRRMMESGVYMGFVDEVVTTMYTHDPGTKK